MIIITCYQVFIDWIFFDIFVLNRVIMNSINTNQKINYMSSKIILKFSFFISIVLIMQFSCKKKSSTPSPNPSTNSPVASSRDVTYELTGNASGQFANISAIYFSSVGDAESENTITLPWSKSVTINNNVPAITFQTAVSNAIPGQTITAKIIVGGVVKLQETATVKVNGDVSLALPAYTF